MARKITQKRDREELLTADELQSRCRAAARMALRGPNWSAEDREDVASKLVLAVWEKATEADAVGSAAALSVPSSVAHGPAVTYTKYSAQKSLDTVSLTTRRTTVPAKLARFDFLVKRASNERRAVEIENAHTEALAMDARRDSTYELRESIPADETGSTPWDARRSAVEMLRDLGMIGARVGWGPLWTLAYAAARAVESTNDDGSRGGLDRETVSAELEIDPATVRQHLARAAARIPAAGLGTVAPTVRETAGKRKHSSVSAASPYGYVGFNAERARWAEALSMPNGGRALKPSRSRSKTGDLNGRLTGLRDWIAPEDHAEVTTRRAARIKRKPDAWQRGPKLRPDWTRDLPTGTAGRLETAAKLRQARARGDAAAAAGTLDSAA